MANQGYHFLRSVIHTTTQIRQRIIRYVRPISAFLSLSHPVFSNTWNNLPIINLEYDMRCPVLNRMSACIFYNLTMSGDIELQTQDRFRTIYTLWLINLIGYILFPAVIHPCVLRWVISTHTGTWRNLSAIFRVAPYSLIFICGLSACFIVFCGPRIVTVTCSNPTINRIKSLCSLHHHASCSFAPEVV